MSKDGFKSKHEKHSTGWHADKAAHYGKLATEAHESGEHFRAKNHETMQKYHKHMVNIHDNARADHESKMYRRKLNPDQQQHFDKYEHHTKQHKKTGYAFHQKLAAHYKAKLKKSEKVEKSRKPKSKKFPAISFRDYIKHNFGDSKKHDLTHAGDIKMHLPHPDGKKGKKRGQKLKHWVKEAKKKLAKPKGESHE